MTDARQRLTLCITPSTYYSKLSTDFGSAAWEIANIGVRHPAHTHETLLKLMVSSAVYRPYRRYSIDSAEAKMFADLERTGK